MPFIGENIGIKLESKSSSVGTAVYFYRYVPNFP